MGCVGEIKVYPYKKFKPGTGRVEFHIPGGKKFILDKDQIRKLYYEVLGIDGLPETSIDDEIENVRANDFINVDVPEDILKVERKFDLEEHLREQRKITQAPGYDGLKNLSKEKLQKVGCHP